MYMYTYVCIQHVDVCNVFNSFFLLFLTLCVAVFYTHMIIHVHVNIYIYMYMYTYVYNMWRYAMYFNY